MTLKEQYNNFRESLIENIQTVVSYRQPQGWLPIEVSVIEYPETDVEDVRHRFILCQLIDIFDTGECFATTIDTPEGDPYGLSEMTTESLIVIWERYVRMAATQNILHNNAVFYLWSKTKCTIEEAEAFVNEKWNPEMLFTENLEAFNRLGGKENNKCKNMDMKTENELLSEQFETMTVNGVPVLFTSSRIERRLVPDKLFVYDIRESDDGDRFAIIEPVVRVNHGGTIISFTEFRMEDWGGVEIEDYNFEGSSTTLMAWIELNR
ncbi:LPD28 domain-containing protein [uncultured Duncaniella sp.]|uniref:LPD28 domain-containing protein n=1 Tax=uncultured Duncaniella sp. TaxID=2768039 RepID=UPI0025AA2D40|nr:LPD28 domain-containing protein [uncultured Duncaniella sp.]